MYCMKCNYHLKGVASDTCPECGHPFLHDNPSSYLSEPRGALDEIMAWASTVGVIWLHMMLVHLVGWVFVGQVCKRYYYDHGKQNHPACVLIGDIYLQPGDWILGVGGSLGSVAIAVLFWSAINAVVLWLMFKLAASIFRSVATGSAS